MFEPRVSRRSFLRTALVGGTGLAGAYLLACGDGGGEPAATSTLLPGAAGPTPTSAPLSWRRVNAIGSGASSDEFPPPRRDHSAVWDGSHLYVFGGRNGDRTLGDLWAFGTWAQESQWNNKLQANEGPPARFGHNAVWAPGHRQEEGRMLVFGGQGPGGGFYNDTWAYDPATGHWEQLAAGDPAPAPRYGAAAAVVFGGQLWITHGFTRSGRFDDTWAFSYLTPTGWKQITPAAPRPVERCLMRAVADSFGSHGARLLMFGGQTTNTPFLGDLWALEPRASSPGLPTYSWREIGAGPKPSPRKFYAWVFDDVAGQAVLFGGDTEAGPVNDLWAFDTEGERWSQLTPQGEAPSPRVGHDAAKASGASVFVFGGNDGSADLNELWVLSTG